MTLDEHLLSGVEHHPLEPFLPEETQGKGHFVGINYYVHCPTPMWYGEGDDMWFIDGEKVPSLIGTGTEDFFNTAWCPKEAFSHPYFGYPRVNNDIGWLGRTHPTWEPVKLL